MSVICLCENNALKPKSIKAPFAQGVFVFYAPLKKLKSRHRRYLKKRLASFPGVCFSCPEAQELLPKQPSDKAAFYRHILVDLTRAFYMGDSPCLFDASLAEARAMLFAYPMLSLAGSGALGVASELYRECGAAVFVSSGNAESFCIHTKDEGGDLCLSLAEKRCSFIPRSPYASLCRYLKRPLSLSEAARLYAYDQSASFIIEAIKKPTSPFGAKKD